MYSLRKRQQSLESTFAHLAGTYQLDVCRYRLISEDEERPKIMALASALADFQALFTQVYDALINGPKQRSTVGAKIAAETALSYGYSFAGSVGFVLTLSNRQFERREAELDSAIGLVFEMAKADSSDQIVHYAKELGPPPIRLMYKWAGDHTQWGLSADVQWARGEDVRASLRVQAPELVNLQRAIDETSDEVIEEITLSGQLIGADVNSHLFRMALEDGNEIKGRMVETIGAEYTVELPKWYVARIRKTTRIKYSTDREEVSYLLLSLTRLRA